MEQYGLEEFREFFKEMCNLEHIQKLEDEIFDERMYAWVLRSFKDALRRLVWDEKLKDSLVQCFEIVKDSSLEEFKKLTECIIRTCIIYAHSIQGI